MFAVLALLGWVVVFVRMPTWLALLISVPIGMLGALVTVFGAIGTYWDSHMNSGNDGVIGLVCGLLMLASTVVVFFQRGGAD